MKIELKKKDKILIAIIIVVALIAWIAHLFLRDTAASTVTVNVDGVVQGVYDLRDDQEISINGGTNTLLINNGEVDMIDANCPDQLCVKQRPISANHESIICLPNKIVVEIASKKESDIDAYTN